MTGIFNENNNSIVKSVWEKSRTNSLRRLQNNVMLYPEDGPRK
jgi:hypothetical protein